MPPVLALAAVGAGLIVAGRLARREMARVARLLAKDRNAGADGTEIRLHRDPKTGVYRIGEP
jgi:hypothetical protein